MKKNWVIGCGAVAALGLLCVGTAVALIGGVFALTKPVVDSSEQFLAQVGQGQIAGAYASAGADLRGRMDEAAFATAVKQLGLTEFASALWHNRQIENSTALAEGTVTTKAGGTKPVAVRLVRENGRWAVVGIRYGGTELTPVPLPPKAPSETEVERLVVTTLTEFDRAVRAKDFTPFYDTVEAGWKKELTPGQFRKAFQAFLDEDVDLSPIRSGKPRFTSPAGVDEKGTLMVKGHYLAATPIRFELRYGREGDDWKLTGISVKVGQSDGVEH
jgi:hypothetical protein